MTSPQQPTETELCDCGCGEPIVQKHKHHISGFIYGHQARGKNNPKYKGFHSFEETREYAWSLNFKNLREWKKHCKSGEKPHDIPGDPVRVYKNK